MSLLLLFKTDNAAKSMSAAGGAFSLAGEASSFGDFHFVLASKGAFSLTGGAASLLYAHNLPATLGAFTLTGEAAAFGRTVSLPATLGAFTLTGSLSTAALVEPIVAFGTFGFSSSDATLTYVAHTPNFYSLSASFGAFALSGGGAGLSTAVIEVGIARFSWRSQALTAIVAQPAHASFNWKV